MHMKHKKKTNETSAVEIKEQKDVPSPLHVSYERNQDPIHGPSHSTITKSITFNIFFLPLHILVLVKESPHLGPFPEGLN